MTTLPFADIMRSLGSGLLTFPVTDFDASGEFDPRAYARRVQWLSSYPVGGLFAAGGTGEFFSLGTDEYAAIVETAVGAVRPGVPIVAGVGMGTRIAVRLAREAERAGAAAVLLLPHYLIGADEAGIVAHVRAVCDAVGIGVIYYARDNSQLSPEGVARLADACPNLIGYKDGVGNLDRLVRLRALVGHRLLFVNGMPTAELFAEAYGAVGVTAYSSAVFNFVPELALAFFNAVRAGDTRTIRRLLDGFFVPLARLRDRRSGYAVSLIKAGARLVGRPAGGVRPPLVDPLAEEVTMLRDIIAGETLSAASLAAGPEPA